jgi:hypothetical protein
MDRNLINHDDETSVVCLLASMENVLSTTELTNFMGANRHNIDMSFETFSTNQDYKNIYKFINEKLMGPLNMGLKKLLFCLF